MGSAAGRLILNKPNTTFAEVVLVLIPAQTNGYKQLR